MIKPHKILTILGVFCLPDFWRGTQLSCSQGIRLSSSSENDSDAVGALESDAYVEELAAAYPPPPPPPVAPP